MGLHKVQIGQVWRKDATGETFLVTNVYTEALSTMATLRKTGAEAQTPIRVRIEPTDGGQTLRGFSPTQDEDAF
jgi:hypothetical protein